MNGMRIQHFDKPEGKVTTAQYHDENGTPTASSFGGWHSEDEIRRRLDWIRSAWSAATRKERFSS